MLVQVSENHWAIAATSTCLRCMRLCFCRLLHRVFGEGSFAQQESAAVEDKGMSIMSTVQA